MHDVSNDLWQSRTGGGLMRQVVGPFLLITACPIGVQMIYLSMIKPELDGSLVYVLQHVYQTGPSCLSDLFPLPQDKESTLFLIFLFMLQLFLLILVPGTRFNGPRAPSGHLPEYVDNGFTCFWITLGVGFVLTEVLHVIPATFIYNNLGVLLTQLNISALVVCVYLYFKGLLWPSTGDAGSSGNVLIDFYWGTELYPRVAGVDLKQMIICRYGMMLWCLFTLSFAAKTMEGHDGVLPNGQFVSTTLLFCYLAKFYWWERFYLCAADIQVDRFGFMLCWGTVCFMPLVHTLQNLFMVTHTAEMSDATAYALVFLGNFMTYLNYESDTQRHRVRMSNGKCTVWGRPATIIRAKYTTSDGKEHQSVLSTCGFNGVSRHFHYLPDIANLFLYCSPAGFTHVLPFLYFIYLTSLLLDRTFRIDQRCAAKYGKYWEQYCALVPYKLVPYVF